MPTLQNEYLRIQCRTQGAELTSIQDQNGTEYLWQADPEVWGRHAPVLFPIVGRLSEDQYRLDGKSYDMGQHGFARNMEFEVRQSSNTEVVFTLIYNEETLKKYPFKFELEIAYRLEGKALSTHYTIRNKDDKDIWATIGGHPGFTCPLPGLGGRSEYVLVFEKPESASRHLLEGGNFTGETRLVLDNARELPISDGLFDEDALVFKNLSSNSVTLQHQSGKRVVKMDFEGFPYLGIWSKSPTAPFVCIEPWLGLADKKGFKGEFHEKEGMRNISVGKELSCAYKMEF